MISRICRLIVLSVFVGMPAATAQSVDTVRVGSPSLAGADLVTGSYTLENFRRVDGHDTLMSVTTQTVTREETGGTETYTIHMNHASENDTTIAAILVRANDFALIRHRVTASRDSASVVANGHYISGWVVLPDQPVSLVDVKLEHEPFPVEGQIPWLFPLLPLTDGYEAAIPHFSQWAGREQWKTIKVLGSESITIGARAFNCWKVDGGELFRGYFVTYWIDRATRRVVRGVAKGNEQGPEFWSSLRIE